MQKIIFTQLSIPDIRNLVREELESFFTQKEAKEENILPDSQPEYLTKKEAAELLKCSIATIDNYRRSGKINRYNHLGHIVRFKRSELLAAIEGKAGNKKRESKRSSLNIENITTQRYEQFQ